MPETFPGIHDGRRAGRRFGGRRGGGRDGTGDETLCRKVQECHLRVLRTGRDADTGRGWNQLLHQGQDVSCRFAYTASPVARTVAGARAAISAARVASGPKHRARGYARSTSCKSSAQ